MSAYTPQRVPNRRPASLANLEARALNGVSVDSQTSVGPLLLEVSRIELSASEPLVTLALTNTASKAITAWDVHVTVDGKMRGKGADAYRSFAGLTQESAHILPGQALTVTIPLPAGTASASVPTVTVIGIIFDDKSFAGDASWVDAIFKSRAAELAAWTQAVTEFESLSSATVLSRDALTTAQSHLAATGANDAGDAVRQNARDNLALLIRDLDSQPATMRARLQFILTLARNSVAAASAHSR
jgi:archaellum component FlaF (FlaF/FlaG flagellin family)